MARPTPQRGLDGLLGVSNSNNLHRQFWLAISLEPIGNTLSPIRAVPERKSLCDPIINANGIERPMQFGPKSVRIAAHAMPPIPASERPPTSATTRRSRSLWEVSPSCSMRARLRPWSYTKACRTTGGSCSRIQRPPLRSLRIRARYSILSRLAQNSSR